jgi:Fe-S-cluster containining protein
MGETVSFAMEFNTSLGPIRGKVAVDAGPMRLVDLAPTAFELTNILVTRANRQEEKAGRRISCTSGCGACCCQMVPLSAPEAFYLADLIDSFNFEYKTIVLDRFETIVNELERQSMIDQLLDPEYLDDPVLAIAKQYFHLRMPCPFLVDGSCSIYEHRPVACREYNVTSPAVWCSDPYTHEVVKVPMPLPLSAPLARLTARLTGSKPRLIPLTLVPRWVDENQDLRQRVWPGVELFKRFMAELGPSQ